MFIVSDEPSPGVGGQGGLPGSRETEEQRGVALGAFVGAGVQGNDSLLGHEVVHHSEEALLHLSSVLCSEDDHSALREVDRDAALVGSEPGDPLLGGGGVLARVEDVVVCAESEVLLELLLGGHDHHVAHEQRVVGSAGQHSALDPVSGVPAEVPVCDVELGGGGLREREERAYFGSGVQVVDGDVLEETVGLGGLGDVDFSPPDFLILLVRTGVK